MLVRHGVGDSPLGDVACGDSLPVGAHAGDLADLCRATPVAQVGERPAALNAGKVPVVPGKHHLRPDPGACASCSPVTRQSNMAASSTIAQCTGPNLPVRSSAGARASQIFPLGQLVAEPPHSIHPSH